jgi:hypothetical protein
MDKQQYHQPQFKAYGNIAVLTQGMMGMNSADGMGATSGNRNRTS